MASCFFIGHRETKPEMLAYIAEAAEELIQKEWVSTFYTGGYGEFDRLAREAVIRLKKKYPYIRLFLVLPYHPAVRPTKTPPGYDGTFYPDGMERVSRRYAIVKANQKMIDTYDFLISYVVHGASNARNLLEYAERQQKKGRIHVINLGVPREQFTPS